LILGRSGLSLTVFTDREVDAVSQGSFQLVGLRGFLRRIRSSSAGSTPHIAYITSLPPHVYGYLPPPPPGYNTGYYDGYVVVYDPVTYFIANVVDLLQQQ
jgi:hypothetical protein